MGLMDGIQYTQVLGGNQIVERDCETQPFGAFEAKIKANINGPTTMQPFCKESLAYNKTIGFFTKKECTCYENQCNSAANESKLPILPDKPLDCLAEWCEGNSPCIKANREGICKGQYCVVQIAKSQEIGSGRAHGRNRTLLRTCGALSSETADTAESLGVNYTLSNSATTMLKESKALLCNSGRCNSEPVWGTSGGTGRNVQQTVETRHETRITTGQRRRNAGNTTKPTFLMELVSFAFIMVSLAYA